MNNVETLLSKRWILKRDDRERYYKIKDNIKELRNLFQDKLGYSLVSHQQFIRLDKIPGKPEPWMGITDFKTIEEYQILCFVLIFLEDREIEEQFILSHLTEFVQVQLKVNEEYWLKHTHRKMLVSVLKFCMKEQLIVQNDGNTDNFIQDQQVEALFENTGLSRYFMRNFTTDIFEWSEPSQFMQNEWLNENERDRGVIRRQRIYRRLLLSCGIYRENDELNDDFSYIRNYRKRIQNDFNQFFPCDLQVYQSSAYLILDEEVRMGKLFPKSNALDELVIICCSQIRKGIKTGDYHIDSQEIYHENKERLLKRLRIAIQKQTQFLPSTYRQKSIEQLVNEVYQRMLEIGFAKEDKESILFYPVVAKLVGEFDKEGDKS